MLYISPVCCVSPVIRDGVMLVEEVVAVVETEVVVVAPPAEAPAPEAVAALEPVEEELGTFAYLESNYRKLVRHFFLSYYG